MIGKSRVHSELKTEVLLLLLLEESQHLKPIKNGGQRNFNFINLKECDDYIRLGIFLIICNTVICSAKIPVLLLLVFADFMSLIRLLESTVCEAMLADYGRGREAPINH